MRKILIPLFIIGLLSEASQAQRLYQSWNLNLNKKEIKIGINYGKFSIDSAGAKNDSSYSLGFRAGLEKQSVIIYPFCIITGGYITTKVGNDVNGVDYTIQYLEFPLKLKAYLKYSKTFAASFYGGGYIAAKIKGYADDNDYPYFEPLDYGVISGFTFEFPESCLSFELGVTVNLQDIAQDPLNTATGTPVETKMRYSGAYLMLGYAF